MKDLYSWCILSSNYFTWNTDLTQHNYSITAEAAKPEAQVPTLPTYQSQNAPEDYTASQKT